MNIYYVYFYLREDFTPYYVGKGKNKRAYSKHRKVKLPKDKSRIIIVQDNLSELQAFTLERYYIRWFGRKDNNTGILRNMADGGEGSSGIIISEKTRKLISERLKGKIRSDEHCINISKHRTGSHHSDDTKQKMKESWVIRKQSEVYIGPNSGKIFSEEWKQNMRKPKKLSDEQRQIMSDRQKGREPANKGKSKYYYIDPNGNIFGSATVAAKHYGYKSNNSIFLLCKDPNSKWKKVLISEYNIT